MPDEYVVPTLPRDLKAPGRALYRRICREWELEPAAEELALLAHASRAEDLCAKAQSALDEYGLTYVDRFGTPKERPEMRILRQQRAAVASLVKQISQARVVWQRLELATEREDRMRARAETRRDRRGGGIRRG
jgi:hypothetical protein